MPIPITNSRIVMTPKVAQRLREIEKMEIIIPSQAEVDMHTLRALFALAFIKIAPKEIRESPLPIAALR